MLSHDKIKCMIRERPVYYSIFKPHKNRRKYSLPDTLNQVFSIQIELKKKLYQLQN